MNTVSTANIVSTAVTAASPGRSRLLLHLIELPPHRRIVAFRFRRGITLIDLPLPWIYHIADVDYNPGNRNFYSYRMAALYGSPVQVDPTDASSRFYSLPLPNCGTGGYACSPGAYAEGSDRARLVINALQRFWAECFCYFERCGASHDALYRWAGLRIGPSGRDRDDVAITPYRKWEKLALDDLAGQEWLALDAQPVGSLGWASCLRYGLHCGLRQPTYYSHARWEP